MERVYVSAGLAHLRNSQQICNVVVTDRYPRIIDGILDVGIWLDVDRGGGGRRRERNFLACELHFS